ncbi:aquaporin-like protein [Pseudomassariella vexata]|uniref:Aquaporin-like protein n=1 Tax=Pseudomassariella vexata TaxID=1141098 RepID=A0A1Y2E2L6_9PEZI|nr:aquaporin-like protein [Pseudomassariella vexata]ORY65115.1 aquaporin-like protein [Pseudomassariella vexata]
MRHHHPHNKQWHLNPLQANLVAAAGEFVGTFLFLFFGYGGHIMAVSQSASNGDSPAHTVIFVALSYGFSLLVTAWSFYRISGGLFNPAVTFGLCSAGQLSWTRGAFLILSQLVACICAGGIVSAMFPPDISLVNTLLAPGVNTAQGFFMEMFFTSYLVFVVLMLAIEKSKDTFIAPIGIGLALFVAEIPGVYFTGGSLNPARSFGCAVAARSFPGYHWIYWFGPLMGAVVAAGFYRFVKRCHYEEANPGQDDSTAEEV